MKEVTTPVTTKYLGYDADENVIDAIQFGDSLAGTGKLYAAIAYFCTHGEVPERRKRYGLRTYVGATKEGCYEAELFVASVAAELPLFADLYKAALEWLVGAIAGYVKDTLTGRGDMDKLVDAMMEKAKMDNELHTIMANGLVKANDNLAATHEKLIDQLPQLVEAVRPAMKKAVSPVGRSCKEMQQFSGTDHEVTITEPDADAIRSELDLEVGDVDSYVCARIHELNLGTGHCLLELEGRVKKVPGKISDPQLKFPNNIYSQSLDNHSGFSFTAKPVTKEGELHKLYISDAKAL